MSHRISHGHYDANPLFDRHIWACGFRSFFLAAAGYAVLAVVAWAVHWRGWLDIPAAIPPSQWHAHEMIFGMFGAAIAGFLLTAVPSWTGFPARSGRRLVLLFGIWVAGRICMWFADFVPLTVT